jgi:hypothetical protein
VLYPNVDLNLRCSLGLFDYRHDVLRAEAVRSKINHVFKVLIVIAHSSLKFGVGQPIAIDIVHFLFENTGVNLAVGVKYGHLLCRQSIKADSLGSEVEDFEIGQSVCGESGMQFSTNAEYICMPISGVIQENPLN